MPIFLHETFLSFLEQRNMGPLRPTEIKEWAHVEQLVRIAAHSNLKKAQ